MDPSTQQGFAMAAMGLAGTVAGLFFGWLKDRDKLRYDTKLAGLDAQNATQGKELAALSAQNETQAREITDLKRENVECREHSARQDDRLSRLEAAVAGKRDRL